MERALRKEDDNELPPDVVKSALDKGYNSYMTSEDNFFAIEKYKDFVYPSIYIGDDEIIIVFLILNENYTLQIQIHNFNY